MQSSKPAILIVDDDPFFQHLADDALSDNGFNAFSVSNGLLALSALKEKRFDALIVDLSMPQMDGLRLIALIRATARLRDVPILVATSRRDPTAIDECFLVGANDYIVKPIDWAELVIRLRKLLVSVPPNRHESSRINTSRSDVF